VEFIITFLEFIITFLYFFRKNAHFSICRNQESNQVYNQVSNQAINQGESAAAKLLLQDRMNDALENEK
jgi:hypothetical protein